MKSFKQFTVEGSLHQELQNLGDSASPEKQQAFIDKHLVDKKELPTPEYKEAEVLDLSANRLGDLEKEQIEDVYESVQEGNVAEAEMTDAQKAKREEIVKELKKKMSEFKDRYGDRATDVMYATATKMAMKDDSEDEEELEEGYYSEGVIADLEKIVKTKSAGQVKFKNGKKQKIDLFSASAVLNAYKQLNTANKKKVEGMLSDQKKFMQFVSFAMQASK
jgi:hypothetical protein